ETAMYAALVCASLLLALKASPEGRATRTWLGALVGFATCVSRPEGPVVLLVIGSVLVWSELRKRGSLGPRSILAALGSLPRWLVIVGGLYLAYFAWRLSYFGHLFPNPVYVKAGNEHASELVRDFIYENPLSLLLAGAAWWSLRRNPPSRDAI